MSGPLTTARDGWINLRAISAIDFHNTVGTTTPVTVDGAVYNPYLNYAATVQYAGRLAKWMRKQVTQVNIAAAAAVSRGPAGQFAGIPVAANHGYLAGDRITIASSTDGTYDGNFDVVEVEPTYIVINKAYTAKTFAAGTILGNRAMESIKTQNHPGWNSLELRTRHTNSGDTGTLHIFGRRQGDTAVKLVATVSYTAGTQHDGTLPTALHFGTSYTVTSYWPKTIGTNGAESGTGMTTIYFDTMGWAEFWVTCTVLTGTSAVTHVDYSGF